MPPKQAQEPSEIRILHFLRISCASFLCSSLRIPPDTSPTSAAGISISVPSPVWPKSLWSIRTGMCTICTCLSTSRSGSPISRMVTSHPPHIANHSSASRAAMLHLPTGLELVMLRSRLPQSVIAAFDTCVSKRKPSGSRGEPPLQTFEYLWSNQHTPSVTYVTHSRDRNAPLQCAAWVEWCPETESNRHVLFRDTGFTISSSPFRRERRDPTLYPARDGSHLERREPLPHLAGGRGRRDRNAGRRRHRAQGSRQGDPRPRRLQRRPHLPD